MFVFDCFYFFGEIILLVSILKMEKFSGVERVYLKDIGGLDFYVLLFWNSFVVILDSFV